MKRTAKRNTLVNVGVNLALTAAQLVADVLAHSQALIADTICSLSDLVSDFVILFAGHHSQRKPDAKHHYGHPRFETAASLVLGLLLPTVGVGILWGTATKLEYLESVSHVKSVGLWVVLDALVSKELLSRYMLAVAGHVRSSMLMASTQHVRPDAASLLVVALGTAGNLLRLYLLDPVAAFIVGLMVARTGWQSGLNALHDLMNRAVDQETVSEIREVTLGTPDVFGVHDVWARKMGDTVLVDAHLETESTAIMKVGHNIALEVRRCVIQRHDVLNVMTHVDPVNRLPAGTS